MTKWNNDILNSSLRGYINPHLLKKGWLGRSGATEEQLTRLEQRLGYSLPLSYRNFLAFTNGWIGPLDHFVKRLWSTYAIDWFKRRNQDWIDVWLEADAWATSVYGDPRPITDEEYLVYDVIDQPFRVQYFGSTLEVSHSEDQEIILLNPEIINQDGEWEAWFFLDDGADRYPSFWDLMQQRHRKFLVLDKQ